jgi:cobalt/nickel transport system permease protein
VAIGQIRPLYVDTPSPVHTLAPAAKLCATGLFVVIVVLTPREAVWAFVAYGTLVAAGAVAARVPLGHVARRLVFELPFVVFAVFLPFIGRGPRTDVLGVSLSVEGLWAAWNIVAKGTIGVAATTVLAATTTVPEILRGLDRLHAPHTLTAVMGFMIRYGAVIGDELRRMRVARLSRDHDPRWIWQARAVAASSGALFIRAFERGERVHAAMLARGYDGTMPPLVVAGDGATRAWPAFLLPATAAAVALTAWWPR